MTYQLNGAEIWFNFWFFHSFYKGRVAIVKGGDPKTEELKTKYIENIFKFSHLAYSSRHNKTPKTADLIFDINK